MVDRFSRTAEVVPAATIEISDFWDLLETTWESSRKVFRAAGLGDSIIEISGSTSDNRSFARKSVTELRKAFEENHAVPRSIDLGTRPRGARSGIDFVAAWAWFGIGPSSVKITVRGTERIAVERLSQDIHKCLFSSTSLKRIAPDVVVTMKELSVSSSDDGTKPRANASLGEPKSTSGDIWLRRKWRDHAATFVITVVGGVLVLVAAALLGLDATG